VGGALAISELMPAQYKHMLGGPSLKVDPHTGAVAELVLTFVITMAVLWIIVKGPRNPIIKTWMLSISTVCLVLSGAAYTGPSMNPANVSLFPFLLSPSFASPVWQTSSLLVLLSTPLVVSSLTAIKF
jgi:glycerol uptake facilitator-like aquaporin